MKKCCYITTPIYYPSGNPHLGHAYCTTMCDIFARYKRERGIETYFLTGTDEHGEKIEHNALLAGVTPQEYVDKIVADFKKLWVAMKISNNDFIRTTGKRHTDIVQSVFSRFLLQDDIYLGKYEGWYCRPCESFWTDTQVGENHICPDCGRPVEKASEEAYFYRTGKHLPVVLNAFEKTDFVLPASRKSEMMNNFIKPGLNDLCVSRTSFTWGVQVKENPRHVVYVWLDALLNYITALGYGTNRDELFKEFWENPDSEIIHVVGADISRFHTIYWPMFLDSLNLRLPNKIFVHGLIMMKDGKMSKSKGNVVSPYPLIEKYGVDTLRYYLAREIPFGQNGNFTPLEFVERINGDLVNNYGNLVSRSLSMVNKYFDGLIPEYKEQVNEQDKNLEDVIDLSISKYTQLMDNLSMSEAANTIMEMTMAANKYIEDTKPWVLAKDETMIKNLQSVMAHLTRVIFVSTMLLKPFLVEKSLVVFKALNVDDNLLFDSIFNKNILDNKQINKCEILFPRLDVNKEVEYIASLMSENK